MHAKLPTPFQQRVYDALRRVPAGRVTTYGLLARYLGCRSAQAVGQALRRNPFAPEVPCHRVIAANLHIGGFSGQRSGREIRRKLALLAQEGVLFDAQGRLADAQRVVSLFDSQLFQGIGGQHHGDPVWAGRSKYRLPDGLRVMTKIAGYQADARSGSHLKKRAIPLVGQRHV